MSPKVSDAHKDMKRQEILGAARRVFLAKGFANAVMQDVIAESGMSRGGIYAYFASKEDLILALLDQYDDEVSTGLQHLLDTRPTAWEAVEALLRLVVEKAAGFRSNFFSVFYEYFVLRWREPALLAFHSGRYDEKMPTLAAFLQEGVDRGEFAPRVPVAAIADLLGNLGDGMNLSGLLLGPKGVETEAQYQVLRQTFHHLLGVKLPLR